MLFQAYHYLACVEGAKRGGERKAQEKNPPLLFPSSQSPTLTKPATQGNPCLPLVNYSTVQLFDCRVGKRPSGGGRGFTPLYKLYRYMPPHRVGILRRFGLKTGIHFAHFSLESQRIRCGFRGN